ncbi:hypothetical protein [Rhizobium ruizarguesonis]|uniref:hypothetical protein n=1 Tax=Rhizobium ruizarguesonis TaxID=2081791 RepID=UPI001CF25AED|nr:hypothetical protein [Rhizobium ruizarguesonis]MCB2399350.1 hypothetical protein [Rhizobium ruizarguesonis]
MSIDFSRIVEYLDAIANHPDGNDTKFSPHRFFWRVDRASFIAMNVPGVACVRGTDHTQIRAVIPGDADNSPLLKILAEDGTVCAKPQMPGSGPFLTDAGYAVQLLDGTSVSGTQVLADLRSWITDGCP